MFECVCSQKLGYLCCLLVSLSAVWTKLSVIEAQKRQQTRLLQTILTALQSSGGIDWLLELPDRILLAAKTLQDLLNIEEHRLYKKLHSWKLYRTFRTPQLLAKYKCLSKACSSALKCYQSQYENQLVENGNLGAFYKYVNCKLNGSNGISPFKDEDGNLVISDSGKASLLNNSFCSVFTTDNGIIEQSSLPHPTFTPTTLPFSHLVRS